MTKKELRKLYKEKKRELGDSAIEKLQDLVLIHFQKLPLPFINCVSTYLPVHTLREVNTYPVIDYLDFRNPGLTVVIPKTDKANCSMRHYVYNEETILREDEYHIMEPVGGQPVEPSAIDLVLVPLLAFDEKGNRVGYGKGFYDRFLATCRPDVIKVGLSFFSAEVEIEDTDDFDISLNYCVTPHQVYEF